MEKSNISHQSYIKSPFLGKISIFILIILGWLLGLSAAYFSYQSIVALGVGLLLIAFLIEPSKFLLLYLAIIPLVDQLIPFFTVGDAESRFGPHILLRGGLTVLLVFYWLINQKKPMIFWVSKPIFIFIPLLALSTIYGGSMLKAGIISLTKITLWMLLLITVANLVMLGRMKITSVYRFTLISVILFVASLFFTQIFYGNRPIVREESVYGVGEFTGAFGFHSVSIGLSMGLVLVLFLSIRQRNSKNIFALLLLAGVVLVSIMKTYVRSGYVCSVIGLLTLCLLVLRYAKGETAKRQKLIIIVALVLVTAIATFYGITHIEALEARFGDTTGSGRTEIWSLAINAYMRFPLINKLIGGGYVATRSFYKGTSLGPHNGYIFFLLEGGILGLLIYIWFFVSIYRQIKLNIKDDYSHFILSTSIITIYLAGEMTNGVFNIPSVTTFLAFLSGGPLGYYLSLADKNPDLEKKL